MSIKKLASQTLWYGVSSIVARFINYLLTPYLTYKFLDWQYGEMSMVYSFIPFMNVVFTYGMETAYFRFSTKENKEDVFNTTSISMLSSTLILSFILVLLYKPLATLLKIDSHPEYMLLSAAIIGLDTLTTIPYARLRQDARPRKFAFTKLFGIIINIITLYFFLSICPKLIADNPNHWVASFFIKDWAVGYVLLANLVQSVITLLLLSKEFTGFKWKFDTKLWKSMMYYGLPLIVAGFAGMINETFDRIMLGWWAPVQSVAEAKAEVGTYAACYKLSILISLSVQAFRMGAEPFFFKTSTEDNAPRTYARVMKFFVITLCIMFLIVAMYLDIWKYFIRNPKMYVGLRVVPILLLANMFLGIYYNLSVWYKLAHKTMAGAWITVIGAALTMFINYFFIPYYSYMACAWATFGCYGSMMVVSYVWGQKYYRIPYAWKKLSAYILISVALYFVHKGIITLSDGKFINLGSATLLLWGFLWFVGKIEKKELMQIPILKTLL